MKNFIRKYILFLLTVLGLLSGCETQETVTKDNLDIIKGMKFYEKSFDALFLETKFNQAFVKLPKIQIQNPTSVQSRNAIEDGYGFTIIPDLVRIVEKDDYTYYNFFVIKDTASYKDVNNFVIKLKDNGEMDAYLTKYKDILQAGNNVNNVIKEMQQVFSNRSLASSEVHCITFSQLMCNDLTTSGIYSSDHPFDIDACDGNHVYISSVQICFPNGSGGSEGSNGSGGTLGSSGGTGVHGGGTGGTSGVVGVGGVGVIPIINEPPANTPPIIPVIVVSPIIRNHYSPRYNKLGLSSAKISWLNQEIQQPLLNLIIANLSDNGITQDGTELIDNDLRDRLNYLIDLGYTNEIELVFGQNVSSDLQDYSSITEINSLIDQIKSITSNDVGGNSPVNNVNQIFSTKTITLNMIHELVIEVVFNKTPFSLDNNGCTSYFSSIVIGNNWIQNSMSLTNENYNGTGTMSNAQITLVGYNNIGINFEGLQFGIKQRKQIKFLINKTSGNICCINISNLN